MRKHMRAGAIALLFLMAGSTATAQMSMLPQLFRELPPELRDGLPVEMEYDEYLEMTRSVDFFSMFMAIWVPGYALFGVGEPTLGWGVAGVHASAYRYQEPCWWISGKAMHHRQIRRNNATY